MSNWILFSYLTSFPVSFTANETASHRTYLFHHHHHLFNMLPSATMAALRRPAMLAGSAVHEQMASPLRLGVGLQAARLFQTQQRQLLKPFASRCYASVSFSSSSSSSHNNKEGDNRGRYHSGSSSSNTQFPRLRYLAASVPLVMVANEAPATSAPVASSNHNNYGLPLNAEVASQLSKGSVLGTFTTA